jgi:drug/metabolite transporter (DMT)-like permease
LNSQGRIALVLLLAAVYAVCYSAIKVGLEFAPPLRFGGMRAAAGGAALLVLLSILRLPLLPPRRFVPGTLILALASTLLGYGGMFLSPGRTGAGIASVLGNSGPLIVVALAAAFLGERVTRGKVAAMSLGFVGVSLIAFPAITDPTPSGAWAALLPLSAAVGFAAGTVILKRMNAGDAFLSIAAWQLLVGGASLLFLAARMEGGAAIAWSIPFLLLLLFLSLLGTAFATALWYWLIQRDDVGRLSLLLLLVPVLGLGLAVILFRERIGIREAVGVLVTVAGLAVLARESRAKVVLLHGRSMRGRSFRTPEKG